MAFHFEDDDVTIIDINDARIFTRPLNDPRPLCRQRTEPLFG